MEFAFRAEPMLHFFTLGTPFFLEVALRKGGDGDSLIEMTSESGDGGVLFRHGCGNELRVIIFALRRSKFGPELRVSKGKKFSNRLIF